MSPQVLAELKGLIAVRQNLSSPSAIDRNQRGIEILLWAYKHELVAAAERAQQPPTSDAKANDRLAEIRLANELQEDVSATTALVVIDQLTAERDEARKEVAIRALAVDLEEDLQTKADSLLGRMHLPQGWSVTEVAQLLIAMKKRIAADWCEVGRLRPIVGERDALRRYVGTNDVRSDYRTADEMRATIEGLAEAVKVLGAEVSLRRGLRVSEHDDTFIARSDARRKTDANPLAAAAVQGTGRDAS